jgi:hypothetical protein
VCLCFHYAECYDALVILRITILSVKILSLLSLCCHYPECHHGVAALSVTRPNVTRLKVVANLFVLTMGMIFENEKHL